MPAISASPTALFTIRGENGHLWSVDAETGSTLGTTAPVLLWTDAGCDGRPLLPAIAPRFVTGLPDGGRAVRPDTLASEEHLIGSWNYSPDGGCAAYGPAALRTVPLDALQPVTDTKPADFVGPLHVEF